MLPASFDYTAPKTVKEAVKALNAQPDALVLVGGYRPVIELKMRRLTPPLVIDLRKIADLNGISVTADGVQIGAATTLRTIMDNEALRSGYAALVEAAEQSGDPQMRNMEAIGAGLTDGGRTSDVSAALLALDATVYIAGSKGDRTASAADFYAASDDKRLGRGEIVIGVSLPTTEGGSAYEKFKHPATLIPVCGVAVNVTMNNKHVVQACAFGVTGAADHPARLSQAEAKLQGQTLNADSIAAAAAVAGDGLSYVSDLQFSGEYREHLVHVLLKRALTRYL